MPFTFARFPRPATTDIAAALRPSHKRPVAGPRGWGHLPALYLGAMMDVLAVIAILLLALGLMRWAGRSARGTSRRRRGGTEGAETAGGYVLGAAVSDYSGSDGGGDGGGCCYGSRHARMAERVLAAPTVSAAPRPSDRSTRAIVR